MNEAIVSEITNCIKAHLERVGDLWEAPAIKVAEAYKYKPDHFERFCAAKGLSSRQRLILGAVLISYTYPTFFNSIVVSLPLASAKSLGCYHELNTGISYPTIQTLLFIHCGYFFEDYSDGLVALEDEALFKNGVLQTILPTSVLIKNSPLTHVVYIGDDYLPYFFTGEYGAPKFSASFPAQKITTKLSWPELAYRLYLPGKRILHRHRPLSQTLPQAGYSLCEIRPAFL